MKAGQAGEGLPNVGQADPNARPLSSALSFTPLTNSTFTQTHWCADKPKKDPNAPKKPPHAFMLFSNKVATITHRSFQT